MGEATEVNEEVREFDGVEDPIDVAGLPARCARLPFVGVRLGRRAAFWRVGVLFRTGCAKDVGGEHGLGDRKG